MDRCYWTQTQLAQQIKRRETIINQHDGNSDKKIALRGTSEGEFTSTKSFILSKDPLTFTYLISK